MQNNYLVDQYLYCLQLEKQLNLNEELELLEEISLSSLKNFYEKRYKKIESILKQFNVSTRKIKESATRLASDVRKDFEKGLTPEQTSQKILNKVTSEMKSQALKAKAKIEQLSLQKKLIISILGFIACLYIGTMLSVSLSVFIKDKTVLTRIVSVVVAPLTEEALKNYFIVRGLPWVGTGVVFGIEFLVYVLNLIFSGFSLIRTLILRLTTIMMHFSTTFIQKKIIDMADDTEEDIMKKRYIAFATGVAIHSLWNAFSIVYDDQISAWSMK